MENFKERDSIRLLASVEAEVIGEQRTVLLPVGTLAAVVLVHGDPNSPEAYELESYISEGEYYVLTTVPANKIDEA